MPATPSLDGLRAVAIVTVALFHFPTHAVVVGGLVGVGVFFVLSGFLVTSLLSSEYSQSGTIVLRRFAQRRAWRLLPALLAFLAVFVVADAAFGHTLWFASSPFGRGAGRPVTLLQAAAGVGASISYTFNFFLAHSVHMASPLGHLWTLSVEGQFYLLWAVMVLVLVRRGPRWRSCGRSASCKQCRGGCFAAPPWPARGSSELWPSRWATPSSSTSGRSRSSPRPVARSCCA
ncbi:MAG: acyltransferase family protein [Acidimicrobiales bacterium]